MLGQAQFSGYIYEMVYTTFISYYSYVFIMWCYVFSLFKLTIPIPLG